MSRPIKTKRDHFLWQEIVLARPDVSRAFKLVAWRLALYRNLKTGRCDPSYSELGNLSVNSESTAKRAIAEFIRLGFMELERSGGGAPTMTNKYRLLIPDPGVSVVTPLKASAGVSAETVRGDSRGVKNSPRGVKTGHEGCHSYDLRTMMNTKREHSSVEASTCVAADKKGAGEGSNEGSKEGQNIVVLMTMFERDLKARKFGRDELIGARAQLEVISEEHWEHDDPIGHQARRLIGEVEYQLEECGG